MADVRVVIDELALQRAVAEADGVEPLLLERAGEICSNANLMSTGDRTGIWHDHATGEVKGDTEPEYDYDVMRGRKGWVGIVYTANYAAQKNNHRYNTLLKAKG